MKKMVDQAPFASHIDTNHLLKQTESMLVAVKENCAQVAEQHSAAATLSTRLASPQNKVMETR